MSAVSWTVCRAGRGWSSWDWTALPTVRSSCGRPLFVRWSRFPRAAGRWTRPRARAASMLAAVPVTIMGCMHRAQASKDGSAGMNHWGLRLPVSHRLSQMVEEVGKLSHLTSETRITGIQITQGSPRKDHRRHTSLTSTEADPLRRTSVSAAQRTGKPKPEAPVGMQFSLHGEPIPPLLLFTYCAGCAATTWRSQI